MGVAAIDAANRDSLTVAIVGAECSGKTTLSQQLAAHFGAPWVPEYARAYLREPAYTRDDVLAIARGQHAAEIAADAPLVIADTDLVVIEVWWQVRFGGTHPWIDATLRSQLTAARGRAYVLTTPDIPWVADPLRENPHDRAALHAHYVRLLQSLGAEYVEVSGSREARLRRAIAGVEGWLSR